MGFFDRIKDSVSLAGAGVSQKVSYTADTMKLNNQIRSNDKEVEKLTYQVGLRCLELHLNEEASEYEELFAQIRRLRADNDALREEIHRLGIQLEEQERLRQQEMQEKQAQREQERREREELARQQANAAQDAVFTEIRDDGQGQPDEPMKFCPNCGKPNDSDAMFCIYCGKPYEEQPAAETQSAQAPTDETQEVTTAQTSDADTQSAQASTGEVQDASPDNEIQ